MGMLDEKAIMITGAASGIGRATALEAASEGARLLLLDVEDAGGEELAAQIGGETLYRRCDVTDEDSVRAMVELAAASFGRLDGAFNCAGILGPVGNVGELPFEDWKRVLDVNLNSVFLCTKYELAEMAARQSGAILNMASAGGLIGWPGSSGYVAAKHAVVGLSKNAALEYAQQGIRVNSICPAFTLTPLIEKDLFEGAMGNDEQMIEGARASHPMGRFARPEEIAAAAVWLLSDKASYVNGAAISVDGAYTAR